MACSHSPVTRRNVARLIPRETRAADQGVRDRLLEAAQKRLREFQTICQTVRDDSAKYEHLARELKIKVE